MALNWQIQTSQILKINDEVCIPSLPSILIAALTLSIFTFTISILINESWISPKNSTLFLNIYWLCLKILQNSYITSVQQISWSWKWPFQAWYEEYLMNFFLTHKANFFMHLLNSQLFPGPIYNRYWSVQYLNFRLGIT